MHRPIVSYASPHCLAPQVPASGGPQATGAGGSVLTGSGATGAVLAVKVASDPAVGRAVAAREKTVGERESEVEKRETAVAAREAAMVDAQHQDAVPTGSESAPESVLAQSLDEQAENLGAGLKRLSEAGDSEAVGAYLARAAAGTGYELRPTSIKEPPVTIAKPRTALPKTTIAWVALATYPPALHPAPPASIACSAY